MSVKPYASWTEAELTNLVSSGEQERAGFEYKQSDALRAVHNKTKQDIIAEVSKDFSAMTNSDGGVFVYGIKEKNQVAVAIDNGFLNDPPPKWLEDIALQHIRPVIQELHIFPISLSGSNLGRYAYLVEIGRSLSGHQANDFRYYRRRNFQNDMLEDWEIRELMNRAMRPRVELTFDYSVASQNAAEHHYDLFVRVRNLGPLKIDALCIELEFPDEFQVGTSLGTRGTSQFDVLALSTAASGRTRWSFQRTRPFFPEQTLPVVAPAPPTQWRYKVNNQLHQKLSAPTSAIDWVVYADSMPPMRGTKPIDELNNF